MIFTRTPFRFPIGGGGTDLPAYYQRFGGFLVTAAVDKYMYINVNRPLVDDLIRVKYSKSETVGRVEDVQHTIVREALRLTGITNRIEILSLADAPAGTGLGSSSSFTVGLLKALHTLKREAISQLDLAEEACHLEIDILKKPIGKQDQYAAAMGGMIVMEIDKQGRVTVEPAGLSPEVLRELEFNMLVFYTHISRESDQILAEEGQSVNQPETGGAEKLHQIKEIGREILRQLRSGHTRAFGELLDAHWQVKRGLSSRMSTSQIDRWYALARENGAVGGKLMGAGGGGFFLFYCDENKEQLRQALAAEGLREMFFRFDPEGSKVLVDF